MTDSPTVIIRIPEYALNKIKIISQKKGLAISATIRELICEKLNEKGN